MGCTFSCTTVSKGCGIGLHMGRMCSLATSVCSHFFLFFCLVCGLLRDLAGLATLCLREAVVRTWPGSCARWWVGRESSRAQGLVQPRCLPCRRPCRTPRSAVSDEVSAGRMCFGVFLTTLDTSVHRSYAWLPSSAFHVYSWRKGLLEAATGELQATAESVEHPTFGCVLNLREYMYAALQDHFRTAIAWFCVSGCHAHRAGVSRLGGSRVGPR